MGSREEYEARKLALKAERDKNKLWFRQVDPINRFTGWLVTWTALLFVGTVISAAILYKTDTTLRETLAANERPWVRIEIEPDGDFSYSSDLGIEFLVKLNLSNIGKTPALYTSIEAEITTTSLFENNAIELRKKVCESARTASSANVGYMIFPNDHLSINRVVSVPREEASLFFKSVVPNSNPPRYVLRDPAIIACASYRSSISHNEIHNTGIIAWLGQRLSSGFIIQGLVMNGSSVPKKEILIDRAQSFLGDAAD